MADGIPPKSDLLGDVESAVSKLDFLVVSDYIMSELASKADVILPAATFSEIGGTYTNLERRVQLLSPGMRLTGEERPGWQTLASIGMAMGAEGFGFDSPQAVFSEIAGLVEPYKGLSHERLAAGGLQWPVPAGDHPGTQFLYAQPGERKPRFAAVTPRTADDHRDPEFPLVLAHGRVLHDRERDIQVEKVGSMNQLRRDEVVELHPDDARELGISEGDIVDLRSRPGPGGRSDLFTGRARLTSPHRGMVAITTLFATIASDVEESQHPDPSPRIRGLPLRHVAVVRAPVEVRAAAD
jgi:predicted molibdopterin-dependent oxidoreductase YjgC